MRCALGLSLVCATPVGTVPAATVETEREVDPTLPSSTVPPGGERKSRVKRQTFLSQRLEGTGDTPGQAWRTPLVL